MCLDGNSVPVRTPNHSQRKKRLTLKVAYPSYNNFMHSLFSNITEVGCKAKNFKFGFFLFSDGEAQASLRHVLIFSTGADSPPPIGFENQPTIEFIDGELPKSNTCVPTLYLPLEINEYEKFKAQMDFGILNSPRFGYA